MRIYPSNTFTSFITNVPNSLFLDGNWEVGRAEIQYPYTWNNNKSGKNKAYIKAWNERVNTALEIPTGYYDNINNVIYNLKQLIFATNKFQKDDLDIHYASGDKRTSVNIKNGCCLRLEDNVATILGFEPGTTINKSLLTSPHLSLTTGNVSSLYVYTDIIHSQYAGDMKVPLLRIVGVDRQHGHSVRKTLDRPQYLPVCGQTLDIIMIDVKDETGDSISFQHRNLQ